MTVTRSCPECGTQLPPEHPDAPCPVCLMKLGLESWGGRVGDMSPADLPQTHASPGNFEAPSPERLAPQFPQLEILKLVGQGGMGAVYKARQTSLDRLVALKIIKPDAADDPDFAKRFAREAKALARLSHPNIVTVHDFGHTDELYFFIMELVDGLNLRQMLEAHELQPSEALRIVPAICDALQYAHDEGIVHRDIKPENVLIDKKGRVKIADFGLAKLVRGSAQQHTLTGTHQVMGTPRYMAPEQMEGSHNVDHRADIYSLGVVLYEMLTGELPIGRFAPPSQKVQVNVRLDEVVLRTLEKEPERRYQQASDVKTDLQAIEQVGQVSQSVTGDKSITGRLGSLPHGETFRLDQLPARFWCGSFGLLLVGWLSFAAMWNFRFLTAAVLAMGGIIWFVARWCTRYSPVVYQHWRERTWTTRVSAFLVLMLSCVFGLSLLVGAYCQVLELMFWHPAAETIESFEAKYSGKEYQLIRKLDGFEQSIPNVELVREPHSFAAGVPLFGKNGPHHGFYGKWSVIICTVIGWIVLTCGVAAMLSARNWREIWIGSWRSTWHDGWKPSLVVTGLALISGLLVAAVLQWSVLTQTKSQRAPFSSRDQLSRSLTVDADVKQVSKAIQHWFKREGFWTGDRWGFRFERVPDGKKLAKLDYHEAWQPSPFDRWRMTWKGPQRLAPHLVVTCLASLEPARTKVEIKAPSYLWITKENLQSWLPIIDRLESAIEKVNRSSDNSTD